MLFALLYTPRDGATEERDRRSLKLFSAWQAPAGFEFKGFYDYADGNGGVAIVECSSAEVMLEAVAPWAVFFEFAFKPIVPIEKSTPIFGKAVAWRDSIR
jgi:Protein of unknown function (DUF3303)